MSTSLRRRNQPKEDDGLSGFDHLKSSLRANSSIGVAETEEHRSSTLTNNPMAGMIQPFLIRLLFWDKFNSVDWFRYKARILCLVLMAPFHLFLWVIECIYIRFVLGPIFDHVLKHADEDAPLFVLGHPRTGTTLLHSLLALDDDRFTTCSTFCAGFPHAFLSFEEPGKRLFASMLTETRPMDNMKLHFDLPQEDELGTFLLTGGRYSPYMSIYFPRDHAQYHPYHTMRDVPRKHADDWTSAFLWLCTKLRVRNVLRKVRLNEGKTEGLPRPNRLLLKSPCHTGRIRHILKVYPNAQFVFVHRHPVEIFLSSVHMANTTYGYMFLHQPRDGDLREYIFRQGEVMLEEYVSCVDDQVGGLLVKGKNLVEVAFEDLTQMPYETIERIFNTLEGETRQIFQDKTDSSYPDKLKKHCKELKGYQRNTFDHTNLDDETLQEIERRWKIQFERFGYPTTTTTSSN